MESMFLTSSLDGEPAKEPHTQLAGPRGLNRNMGHRLGESSIAMDIRLHLGSNCPHCSGASKFPEDEIGAVPKMLQSGAFLGPVQGNGHMIQCFTKRKVPKWPVTLANMIGDLEKRELVWLIC